MSSGARVSVTDVGADLGVLLCRGCAGGGVRVPVTGVVRGGDPVTWASGRHCSERGVEGLGLESSCLALLHLLTAVPRACAPAVPD